MRLISFSYTQPQILARTKTVTRRAGWLNLAPGQLLRGVHKAMGLKAGESPRELAIIRVVSARQERIDAIDAADCAREGFPDLSPTQFVEFFCREFRCTPDTIVTRIEFAYVNDPEVLSDPGDRRDTAKGIPRQRHRVRNPNGGDMERPPGRSCLWDAHETMHDPEPLFGVYPQRFLPWVLKLLGNPAHRDLLHVCSGALKREVLGYRLDLRARAAPDVVADGRALPFQTASLRAVLIDPPYTVEYARSLYDTDYPRPSHLLREASRVLKPGGRIGFVHYLVPNPPPGCSLVLVKGLTQGCGYRIRAVTIYERDQAELFA